MGLSIYKPGQGYYTRMLSAVGLGVVVLSGVGWFWGMMPTLVRDQSKILYYQGGMAVLVIALFGAIAYYILNRPNVADFMIATEAEMKKVNWPNKKEIIGSTWVVICGTAFIALLLWIINLGFAKLFTSINLLEG